MQDPTVLQVTKPLKWYNKNVRIDFKKLMMDLSKAVIMFIAGKEASAAKELISVAGVVSVDDDPGGLAYLLILRSMLNAMHDLSTENIDLFPEDLQQLEKLYDDAEYVKFLDGLNEVLEAKKFGIKTSHLQHPKKIAIVPHFCQYLKQWLTKFGISANDAEQLSYRLPDYFVLNFHQEWTKNSNSYSGLLKKLESPASKDVKHIFEWQHYYAFLKQQIQQSVFGESFSLEQIYIPLRGSYVKKVKKENEEVKIKVAVHVEEALNRWIRTEKVDECIKVISGGPGAGKSSLAKIWAASLTENAALKVIFIPLHLFDLTNDFDSSLAQFFKESVDIPLSYQEPIKELQEKTLFIFDGLDELSEQGTFSTDMANRFISFIQRINYRSNQDQHIRFLFLITGRELTIQGHRLNFRKEGQIITLFPYFKQIHALEAKNWENIKVTEEDQRDQWWSRYGMLTQSGHNGIPTVLKEIEKLTEITAQPLLNYLVSLSIKRNKLEITKDTTLNAIYNDLIEGVYERSYERPHIAVKELAKAEFFRIQEEISIAAWHGGDVRTTTIKKIENHIKGSRLESVLNRFKEGAEKGISRLLLAFFFKEHKGLEAGEKTFEFTHKSFGEYLTALRLKKLIQRLDKQIRIHDEDYDAGIDKKRALSEWLSITGSTAMDIYILGFLKDEIAFCNKAEVKRWQQTICRLISHSLEYGMPFEERFSHLEETRRARNSEEALLAALHCCASKTMLVSRLEFKSIRAFGLWFAKFQGSATFGGGTLAGKCLRLLDLNGQELVGKNLILTNLKEAILIETDFSFALLTSSNLQGANLQGANLQEANLQEASLQEANLQNANLENANLKRANLRGANLKRANLWGANLKGVNLKRANLKGANLQNVNLQEANLQNVNLQGANLQGVNLRIVQGLKFEQLLYVVSLKGCEGIPPVIVKKLKAARPELFNDMHVKR